MTRTTQHTQFQQKLNDILIMRIELFRVMDPCSHSVYAKF